MKIAENLKFTFNKMFDLYINKFKQLYTLSIKFSISASIFSLVLTFIFIVLVFSVNKDERFLSDFSFQGIFLSPFIVQRIYLVYFSIIILSISLLSVLIIKNDFNDNISLKKYMKFIPKKIYNKYFIYLFIILLINIILFGDAIKIKGSDYQSNMIVDNVFMEGNSKLPDFYSWFNSVIDLFKTYFPYLLSMMIIIEIVAGNIKWNTIKKYKTAFWAALFFSFIVEVVFNSVYSYIDFYIIYPLKIPFEYDIIPGIIGFSIAIMIFAFFFIAFAAVLLYPFLFEKKKIEKNSPDLS